MPIPEGLLSISDDDRFFRKVGAWLDAEVKRRAGAEFDLDKWERRLSSMDFDLKILDHFMGTWDASGSFVNEARSWWNEEARIKKALVNFGCEKTAAMFEEAAELGMQIANRYDSDQDITPEQAARREELNQLANEDVCYEKLASFIRNHRYNFLR